MSVDRTRVLPAQYHGRLTNRIQIRVNGACSNTSSAEPNVACSQADLTEATKCAKVARFEFQRTRDVVEAIVVTLLDESQRCSSSAIGSRWMAGFGCCGVLGEAPESSRIGG